MDENTNQNTPATPETPQPAAAPAQPEPAPVAQPVEPTPAPQSAPVETAPVEAPAPPAAPVEATPTPAPTATAAPAQPQPQPQPEEPKTAEKLKAERKALKEKKKKRKLLWTLIFVLGFGFFVVVAIAFFILSQGGSGTNPLLQLFGLSEEQLYPFLINMTSLFFGLVDFIAFLVAIVGVFMTAMAKKEDKAKKRKGVIMLAVGMLFFTLFSVIWAGSYFYLQEKKAQYTADSGEVQYILTEPEVTTGLTAPALIEFDASGLPVDTNRFTILSYAWDFGDGSTATGPQVSHRYMEKAEGDGRYVVTLTVSYRDNTTSEEAEEVFTTDVVFGNERVNAFFTATPESGEAPLTVEFDASESLDPDGEIVSYEWDLDGDGSYDDGEDVTAEYTYERYGEYEASLRVTDNNGETDVMTLEIVVEEAAVPTGVIDVTFEDDEVLYVNESYLFDVDEASSPNGEIEKYEWDFGDGDNTTRNKTAKHTYDKAGTYTITLTLTDEDGVEGDVTLEVNVVAPEEAPQPEITTDQDWSDEDRTEITGEVPFTVEFSAEESTDPDDNIVNIEWDLDGDGKIDEAGEEIEYTYDESGTYEATLYVEDSAGNTNQTSITVQVESQSMTASLTADTLNGEIPLTVTLDASGSSYPDGNIVNYFWDFGDGTSKYDTARVNYTFKEIGTFEVTVTAIASDGTEATDSIFINTLPISVSACFEANVNSGVVPLIVTFNPSCSEGTVVDYRWDFGDGDISYARKPTHTFEDAGTYTVTLTVEDTDGLSDTYTSTIAVYSE